MTRDTAVTAIQNRLGNRTGTDLTNLIITEMQQAQTDLEAEADLPWFLKKILTENESTHSFAVESDFIMEVPDISGLSIMEADGSRTVLEKDDYDWLSTAYNGETTGKPERYALVGDTYYLFPTPDVAYSIRKVYYAQAVVLSTNVENVWLKHVPTLLISATGVRVARWLRDEGALTIFAAEFALARTQLQQKDVARDAAARRMELGG